MTDPENDRQDNTLAGIGAILGVGVGAAIGAFADDIGTGIWIGAIIGVGLGLLAAYLRK